MDIQELGAYIQTLPPKEHRCTAHNSKLDGYCEADKRNHPPTYHFYRNNGGGQTQWKVCTVFKDETHAINVAISNMKNTYGVISEYLQMIEALNQPKCSLTKRLINNKLRLEHQIKELEDFQKS